MGEKICVFEDAYTDVAARALGSRDNLFGLDTDFAGMVVPGGSIVVKLIDKWSKRHPA